jgi:nucleotide-binding universal stress UspA family protein
MVPAACVADHRVTDETPTDEVPGGPMFTKILAGVDETAGSVHAAELAEEIARAMGADLLLMTAYQDPLLPFPLTLGGSPTHRLHDAETLLRTVRPAHAPHAHTRAIPDFSTSRALRRTAQSEGVDLVVLGGARAASNGNLCVGRTGRQVVHGAPFPVAFASPNLGRGAGALRRIVVGVDGGPEAVLALRVATQLGTAVGAEVAAVSVLDDRVPLVWAPLGLSAEMARWDETMDRRHERIAARMQELVPDQDGVESEIVVGDPLEQLSSAAHEADLLVLGSRAWGSPGRISLGSTADALCQGTPCSLLIVPRPDAAVALPHDLSAATANGVHPR